MGRDRLDFQTRFADYRNTYLEHRKGRANLQLRDEFHRLESAELVFENVWQAMEDYVVLYAKVNMPPEKAAASHVSGNWPTLTASREPHYALQRSRRYRNMPICTERRRPL